MDQYRELLRDCFFGAERADRTGVGTTGVFGYQMRFNLAKGFPLVTTKKVHFKSIIHELLWMISGDTNIKYLKDNGVRIWNEWSNASGDLGPVYGHQWRAFGSDYYNGNPEEGVDQLAQVIEQIKNDPYSRRHIVSAWNPVDIPHTSLPPCHLLYQFYVNDGKLSCQMYQRSADAGLGVPFNIASYALLTHMVAQVCDLQVGDFIHTFGDVHIYKNHIEPLREQIKRTPRPLPVLELNSSIRNIDDFRYEDIKIVGYNPHPHIHLEVSV